MLSFRFKDGARVLSDGMRSIKKIEIRICENTN